MYLEFDFFIYGFRGWVFGFDAVWLKGDSAVFSFFGAWELGVKRRTCNCNIGVWIEMNG
jgi:hypothetical protein